MPVYPHRAAVDACGNDHARKARLAARFATRSLGSAHGSSWCGC
jgi:hypothetical protein